MNANGCGSPVSQSRALRLLLGAIDPDQKSSRQSMDLVISEFATPADLFSALLDMTGIIVTTIEASGERENWEDFLTSRLAALSTDWAAAPQEESDQEPLIRCTAEVMSQVDDSVDRMIADLRGDPRTTQEIMDGIIAGCSMTVDELGSGPETANVLIGTLALKLATAVQRLALPGE